MSDPLGEPRKIRLRRVAKKAISLHPSESPQNIIVEPSIKILRVGEFNAGVGGFRIGFAKASVPQASAPQASAPQALVPAIEFKTVFANDIDVHSKLTYDTNFGKDSLTCADITALNIKAIPDFDIFASSFSCHTDHTDTNHFDRFIEILEYKKPRWAILETMKNIINHEGGQTLETVNEKLKRAGYTITTKLIDVSKVTDSPQARERLYIVGARDISQIALFTFPSPRETPPSSVMKFLEPAEKIHDKYYYQPGKSIYDALNTGVTKEGTVYQYRRYYVRENKSERCPTFTANMGSGGNNVPILKDKMGIRKMTPRECFRFQTFPDTFIIPIKLADYHAYHQAGHSVTPEIITLLAKEILRIETDVKI